MDSQKKKVFVAMTRLRQGYGGQDGDVLDVRGKRVFVAMSGGVDSSVAALLLKEKGYEVTGVFMRCYNVDGCAVRDAEDARRVANHLGIPFYVFDFEEDYKREVVEYMIDGYRRGITPNPDVMCNKRIKFGLFLEKALSLGTDYIATGHYARLRVTTDSKQLTTNRQMPRFVPSSALVLGSDVRCQMFSARDARKDQSYFLWTLTQDQLKHCLFPVGDYLKSEVREIARRAKLPTAEKKDSQGICFLGKVALADFLSGYIPEKEGDVLSTRGEKLGAHRGAWFYTIGQRHIGVANRGPTLTSRGLTRKENSHPLYVAEKDVGANTITVAEGSDSPELYRKEVELTDVNFINPQIISLIRANGSIDVLARVRYRQPLVKARIMNYESGIKLRFDEPVKFVAPGQSAVFYRASDSPEPAEGYKLLGGGVIV